MIENTFAMIKGDAVRRGLIGKVLTRFEDKGLTIADMKFVSLTNEQVYALYVEHKDKPFFNDLLRFTVNTPVVILCLRGNCAVSVVRKLIGATDCCQADPGTIRGDFGISMTNRTLVHASRTLDDAYRELSIFFPENELCKTAPQPYMRCDWQWIVEAKSE